MESSEQSHSRLLAVIRQAEFDVLPGVWYFREFGSDHVASSLDPQSLAIVRDGDRWSQLTAGSLEDVKSELMAVCTFHFPSGQDNSGFVGWLASQIKQETGSGVAVICGQNSRRGGIFDYWLSPLASAPAVIQLVTELRSGKPG